MVIKNVHNLAITVPFNQFEKNKQTKLLIEHVQRMSFILIICLSLNVTKNVSPRKDVGIMNNKKYFIQPTISRLAKQLFFNCTYGKMTANLEQIFVAEEKFSNISL